MKSMAPRAQVGSFCGSKKRSHKTEAETIVRSGFATLTSMLLSHLASAIVGILFRKAGLEKLHFRLYGDISHFGV